MTSVTMTNKAWDGPRDVRCDEKEFSSSFGKRLFSSVDGIFVAADGDAVFISAPHLHLAFLQRQKKIIIL